MQFTSCEVGNTIFTSPYERSIRPLASSPPLVTALWISCIVYNIILMKWGTGTEYFKRIPRSNILFFPFFLFYQPEKNSCMVFQLGWPGIRTGPKVGHGNAALRIHFRCRQTTQRWRLFVGQQGQHLGCVLARFSVNRTLYIHKIALHSWGSRHALFIRVYFITEDIYFWKGAKSLQN